MDTDRFCRKLGKKGLFQIQGYQATGNVWKKDKKTHSIEQHSNSQILFSLSFRIKSRGFWKVTQFS